MIAKSAFWRETFVSTMLFISSFICSTIIHESGHAFFVRINDIAGIWYHNRVDYNYQQLSSGSNALICAGGSLATLLQFLVLYPMALRYRGENRLLRILLYWLTFWSVVQFLGYFVIGIFPIWNDISGIYMIYDVPMTVRVLVAVGSVLSFKILLTRLSVVLTEAIPAQSFGTKDRRIGLVYVMLPAVLSTGVITVINFPIVHVMSLMYPLSIPLFVLSTYFRIINAKYKSVSYTSFSNLSIAGVTAFCMLMIIVFRFFASGVNI